MKEHPILHGRRVLVVDTDASVCLTAHEILDPCGCIAEAAQSGQQAINMVRNSGGRFGYDCVIAENSLPDMSGYEFMLQLQDLGSTLPLVLMTSFGYDQSHSIARAR